MSLTSMTNELVKKQEPLAIVGIGLRLPMNSNNAQEFWNHLLDGKNGITKVPQDRWNADYYSNKDYRSCGKITNDTGGFIKNIKGFDNEFFNMNSYQSIETDPQIRLLLEVTFEALENAGLRRDDVSNTKTSVFVSSFQHDYYTICSQNSARDNIGPSVATGVGSCSLSNRISYQFNLKGPSVTVDTACSGSLVALHQACQSIWNGEADMAIAGGANALLRPECSIILSRAGFLSPTGSCKAFDSSADGYVRGEGVAVIIIKPLQAALENEDRIYALIRGTATNHDGYKEQGYSVPSADAQASLLTSLYDKVGIAPGEVDYVECHGTGTVVGDPLEIEALRRVIGKNRSHQCYIGSVKTNIGHLEGAAGIVGLIKAALILKHKAIPPNLHYHHPRAELRLEKSNFIVPTQVTQCTTKPNGRPLLAGVNSFGAGGANAHAILSEFIPQQSNMAKKVNSYQSANTICLLFLISDESDSRLLSKAKTYLEYLKQTSHDISDICYTLLQRRSILSKQLLITGYSKEEIIDLLEQFIQGKQHSQILKRQSSSLRNKQHDRSVNKLAFVYSGQGGQWMGMCRKLITEMPLFESKMMEIDEKFRMIADWSLIDELNCMDASTSKINDTKVVQPLIMAVQIALTHVWRECFGVKPDGFVGHSVGEIAAAHCSGLIDLETAVFIIYHRSAIQNKLTNKGKMLAVGMNESEVKQLLSEYPEQVSIAAMNGPRMTVVAGDDDILSTIAADCEAKGIFQAFVKTQIPYHTSIMDEIKDELLARFQHVKGHGSQGDLYSTVTATKAGDIDGKYWFDNVRQPVLFVQTIEQMIEDGYKQFIEIGPHPVLIAGIKQLHEQMNIEDGLAISSIKRQQETAQLFQNLGVYWLENSICDKIAVKKVFPSADFIFDLPRYEWQHKDFWFETSDEQAERLAFKYNGGHPFLRQDHRFLPPDGHQLWKANINATNTLYLADHVVNDVIIFPAVGYVELAYAIGNLQERKKSSHGSEQPKCFVEEITFESAIILSEDRMQLIDTQIQLTSDEGHFVIYTKMQQSDDSKWTRHASGKINTLDRFQVLKQPKLAEVMSTFHEHHLVDVKEFYSFVSESGLIFGEHFQCIRQLWYKNATILSRVSLPEHLIAEAEKYNLHPALFDAALHGLFAEQIKNGITQLYLPHSVDRGIIYEKGAYAAYAYIEVVRSDEEVLQTNTWIYNETGGLVAEFYGLTAKNLEGTGVVASQNAMYEHKWIPQALSSTSETLVTIMDTKLNAYQLILLVDGLNNDLAKQMSTKLSLTESKHVFNKIDIIDAEEQMKQRMRADDQSILFLVYIPSLCQQYQETSEMQEKAWKYMKMIQLVASLNHQRRIELRLITHNSAVSLDQLEDGKMEGNADDAIRMDHALLCGMCRVVENECPSMHVKFIDVDHHALECLDSILDDLFDTQSQVYEREIMYRRSKRYVRRLMQCDHEQIKQSWTKQLDAVGSYYEMEIQEKGLLDTIVFRQKLPKQLRAHEVEIEVHAAGINFKDVMNAMGQLSKKSVAGSTAGNSLGLEVSGIIVNIGSDVKDFDIGDEIMAQLANGYSGRATTAYTNCMKKPRFLSHIQAATIPVVYSTAYYGLIHLARMTKDDTVLIHSATGGVGIACINLAKHIGARIITTVSSKAKREFLENEHGISSEFIFDSRSTTFYDDVMRVTNQQGVDIVMNSLSGVLMTQSIKCLKAFGRFIEIGKVDIYQNKPLCLERLGDNISYFMVDIDRLSFQKPLFFQQMLHQLETLFKQKYLKPLPTFVYSINEISDAFRSLMTGQTIGKLVVNMEDQVVATLPPQRLQFSKEGAFIITGGTRGLGLRMAQWIGQRGINKLVLVSRNGIQSSEDQVFVDQLRSSNIDVDIRRLDIGSMDEIDKLFVEVHGRFGAIRGIIHSAAILRDASIEKMDRDSFLTVIQTKAMGAWNLHHASLKYIDEIEHFILFSSISSTIGNPGQINYVAANYFLDTLAEYRHRHGLPCTSVNLGLLGEYAGISATHETKPSVGKVLHTFGIHTMPLYTVQHQLELAILQQSPSRVTAILDWMTLKQALPIIENDSRFVDIIEKQGTVDKNNSYQSLKDKIVAMIDVKDAVELLQKEISIVIGKISGLSGQSIDLDQSLGKIGFDSLGYTQLRNWLAKNIEINYPIIQLIKVPSIHVLVNEIIKNTKDLVKNQKAQKQPISKVNVLKVTIAPTAQPSLIEQSQNKKSETDGFHFENTKAENSLGKKKPCSQTDARTKETSIQKHNQDATLVDEVPLSTALSKSAYILGIGTANPPICNRTDEVWQQVKLEYENLGMSEVELKKIENLYENSGIETKYCHADFTQKTLAENAREYFNDKYKKIAPDLALSAAQKAIKDWGGNVKDISHVLSCTSTGILLPDVSCLLVEKLNLNDTVERSSINMTACTGGLVTMKAARAFALQNSKHRVLMVCTELCSLHYQPLLDIEAIIGCLRFGDGSGAMILGCEPKKYERSIYEIIQTGGKLLPNTENYITWNLNQANPGFRSNPSVPTIIGDNILSILRNFFNKSVPFPVALEECEWLIHPGGANMLLKLHDSLNIPFEKNVASWNVLQKYANMSSAAIIFVMHDARTRQTKEELNICLAFGPGVSIEIALLRRI